MRGRPFLALLALLASGAAAHLVSEAEASASLKGNDIIYRQSSSGGLLALAPATVLAEPQLLKLSAPSADACSEECRANPACRFFDFCDSEAGCVAHPPHLEYLECRLLGSDCQVQPQVHLGGGHITRTSGFPIPYQPLNATGYQSVAGQGPAGGELKGCSGSVVPGGCAFGSVRDALALCSSMPTCRSVVYYHRGLDACSEPVAVLVASQVSAPTSWVAPSVETLIKQGDTQPMMHLMDGEARVVLPPEHELAAGHAQAGSAAAGPAWLGCIVADQALMGGDVAGLLDGVASPEACCRACRADANCNAWNFCGLPQGCSQEVPATAFTEAASVSLSQGQCQLRWQSLAQPSIGSPPAVLAKGPGTQFAAGAPLALAPPPVDGYTALPGRLTLADGAFPCNESTLPGLQECVFIDTPQSLGARCSADPQCAAFVTKPGPPEPARIGILKHAFNASALGFSPTDALYLRNDSPNGISSNGSSGDSSGLSGGAIAGIAVAATAGGVALAGAAWALLRQRRRQRRQAAESPKVAEEGGSSKPGSPHASDSHRPPLAPLAGSQACALGSGSTPDKSSKLAGGSRKSSAAGLPAAGPCQQLPAVAAPLCGLLPAAQLNSMRLQDPANAAAAAAMAAPSPLAGGQGLGPLLAGSSHAASSHTSASQTGASPFDPLRASPFDTGARTPFGPGSRFGSRRGSFSLAGLGMPMASVVAGPSAISPFASAACTPFATAAWRQASQGLGLRRSRSLPGRDSSAIAGTPPAAPTAAPSGTATGSGTGSGSDTGRAGGGGSSCGLTGHSKRSEGLLPELAQLVAATDAMMSTDPQSRAAAPEEHILATPDSLPPSLQACVADMSQVQLLRWPNGRLQEIGSGASATVYKALFLGEVVAAKAVDIGRSPAAQEAFITEALRLHQLHHPHVVALLGVAIAGCTGVLLMEYCAGRDLHNALSLAVAASPGDRVFSWYRRGRRVAHDISKALNFLHAKGVVHMDVKSSNVLLTGGGTAKLADVGLARLQTGTYLSECPVVGTFAWIAPEVLLGGRKCTAAVDIYSFGVLMWEVITGERPARGSLRMPLVPLECPQTACDLMMECLSQDPAARPTANQLMRRLAAIDNGPATLRASV